jgi:hypothetical protein
VAAHSSRNIGYNAQSMKIEDLVEAGVIDPAKVRASAAGRFGCNARWHPAGCVSLRERSST